MFIVSPPGIHISLGICVWGYTYHGDTHITVTPASRVRYLICDTRSRWKCHAYNAFKTVHFQSNKIKRRYLERAHINGRTDVIRRQIDNNINILLSFCCAVEQGMRSES